MPVCIQVEPKVESIFCEEAEDGNFNLYLVDFGDFTVSENFPALIKILLQSKGVGGLEELEYFRKKEFCSAGTLL